jgi:prolipoprotein diacylglyceryltransferase
VLITAAKRWANGATFAIYIAAYSLGRFFIEGLRIDPSQAIGGLRLNQWTSVVIFGLGISIFYRLQRKPRVAIAGEK